MLVKLSGSFINNSVDACGLCECVIVVPGSLLNRCFKWVNYLRVNLTAIKK